MVHGIIKTVKKVWGEEEIIVNKKDYCGKILTVNKDCRCSLHCHPKKAESFYVLSGSGWIEFGTTKTLFFATKGMIVDIKPGTYHRFSSLRGIVLIEFSTHHEDSDVIRKEPSRSSATERGKQ